MNKITYLTVVLFLCITGSITSQNTEIQRVRLDITSPLGYVRHLLLGFTPDNAATDGVDYGYDAKNIENLPDDTNWMIEGNRYVIQGVGAFNTSKYYPLGIFLTNSGTISIALNSLENFENPINVYVYDAELDTYTGINDSNYSNTMESGTHLNRYYIAFTNIPPANIGENSALSIAENTLQNISISYLKHSKTLCIDSKGLVTLKQVTLYNLQGQRLLDLGKVTQNRVEIAMDYPKASPIILQIQSDDGQLLHKKLILQ
jgi:hypothetical protein